MDGVVRLEQEVEKETLWKGGRLGYSPSMNLLQAMML